MKTTITVRKIPLEAVLSVLLEMREQHIEFVNFECVLSPEKDIIHIIEYQGVNNTNQQSLKLDTDAVEEDRINYIKKIIDEHGRN